MGEWAAEAASAPVLPRPLRQRAARPSAQPGELVHALLAVAPLGSGRGANDALAEVHGRILSAPAGEVAAAAATVARVFAHELLARARAADRGR